MSQQARVKELDEIPEPVACFALLASRPHTMGELVDFANGFPATWVAPTIKALTASLFPEGGRCADPPPVQRRKLVMLGALVDRQIFEVERLPARRDTLI